MLKPEEVQQLKDYIQKLDDPAIIDEVKEVIDIHKDIELLKICVPSYNFTPQRSKFIVNCLEENIPFTVYCYDEQEHLYKDCPDRVLVPWEIRTERKYPLASKLNFMLKHERSLGTKKILRIDDDIFSFEMPIPIERPYGICNEREVISNNLMWHLWSYWVKKHDIDYGGCMSWVTFRWIRTYMYGFFLRDYLPSSTASINLETCPNYDENQGWEDYDMCLQCRRLGLKTLSPTMNASRWSMGKGSTMDYEDDWNITQRSLECIAKWGTGPFKIDNHKFNLNIKLNFRKMNKYGLENLIKPINITDNMISKIREIMRTDLHTQDKARHYKRILNNEE